MALAVVATLAGCGGGNDGADTGDAPVETTAEPTIDPNPLGWTRHTDDSYALSLPASYVGGPMSDGTLSVIRDLGANCAATADLFAEQPEAVRRPFRFMAVDANTCDSSVDSVQVLEVPGTTLTTPDEFIDDLVQGLPSSAELLERRAGTIGGAPAAIVRVKRTYDAALITIQQFYAVRGPGAWFMLVGATLETAFPAAAPELDAIAETLRVQ